MVGRSCGKEKERIFMASGRKHRRMIAVGDGGMQEHWGLDKGMRKQSYVR